MRKNTTGFTIVELLIVIVVIAILASISVVAYSGIQVRAKNTARNSDVRKMANLIRQYAVINGVEAFKALVPFNTYYCLGENYPDSDPGSDTSCYDSEYGGSHSYDRSLPALDSALKKLGNYSIAALPFALDEGSGWAERTSAPELYRYGNTVNVDGKPGFAMLWYVLDGSDVDCSLKPLISYVNSVSGIENYITVNNIRNTGYGEKVTYCNLYIPSP